MMIMHSFSKDNALRCSSFVVILIQLAKRASRTWCISGRGTGKTGFFGEWKQDK
jgi:hypothetical protein